jgi:PBP1b-binding outer membrane lipoprotein LpoB
MTNLSAIWLAAVVMTGCAGTASAQFVAKQPLRLVQTVSMPNVKGRLDHME